LTSLDELIERLDVVPLPVGGGSEPFGRAWLQEERRGIDLASAGYREDEYLIAGLAETWAWDESVRAIPTGPQRFTTRIIVRRPVDPRRFSGSVQIEPHHPDADRALTWAAIGPWIVRGGHAHVGVTQEPWVLNELSAWDAARYGDLRIVDPTNRWDIMCQVAVALRSGAIESLAELQVARSIMSGWSMTGTFCRTFLGEGFHDRARWRDRPAIDGYVICISSGNAQRAGYNELTYGMLPERDARRTIQPKGVPIIELLSEAEAETHGPVLRPDSDTPGDRYRLFEIAGTGHSSSDPERSLNTNKRQLELRGIPSDHCRVNEVRSDARMDLVARAVFQMADDWIADGQRPPVAPRFAYDDPDGPAHRGVMPEAVPLQRDPDGNVLHGVRTPWVEVPAASYLPHSTPLPGGCDAPSPLPGFGPRQRADLVAQMAPFGEPEMARRYGSRARYLELYERSAHAAVDAAWLLEDDLQQLIGPH
jgi:hypothetical protein